jgi:hypothetical protein
MANERERDRDGEFGATLSNAGRQRRDRMHGELLSEMRRVHRVRRWRRNALACSVLVTVVGGFGIMRFGAPATPPSESLPQIAQTPLESHAPTKPRDESADHPDSQDESTPEPVRTLYVDSSLPLGTTPVVTDVAIVSRYRVDADTLLRLVTYLTDEQLVRELAAIGEPTSVIRLPDRVLLVRAEPREAKPQ